MYLQTNYHESEDIVKMDGVNNTVRGKLFELLINNINASIKLLEEYGAQIKDESDFQYYLKEIRYSPAADEVITSFKECKNG